MEIGVREIITVESAHSRNIYELCIVKVKGEEEYRILNMTKGEISRCKFSTYKDAVDDIYKYEREGKNKVIKHERFDSKG